MIRCNLCFVSAFVLGLAPVSGQTTASPIAPVMTQQIQTTGVIGISNGQTARLNVLNPGVPAPLATGALCPARVSFVRDDGTELKSANVSVIPGHSSALDLNRDVAADVPGTGRVEVRAVISIQGNAAANRLSFCRLTPTLEVFDNNTGRTSLVLTGTTFLPIPFALTNMPQ